MQYLFEWIKRNLETFSYLFRCNNLADFPFYHNNHAVKVIILRIY